MKDNRPIPWASTLNSSDRRLSFRHAGLVIDLNRCTGCHACSVACKVEHHVPLGGFRNRVRYLQQPNSHQLSFLPLTCMHCQNATCIKACKHDAILRLEDGRVVIDDGRCDGAGDCIQACPYGAIYLNPQTHRADKCDLCLNRTSLGLEPACVNACPNGAIRYGDLVGDLHFNEAQTFKSSTGAKPSVLYIGAKPWMEAAINTGVQLAPDDSDIIYEQNNREDA